MASNEKPWRFLLVEDNDKISEQIRETLEGMTFGEMNQESLLDVYNNFSEAEKALQTQSFDLLILDLRDDSRGAEEQPADPSSPGRAVFDILRKTKFSPVIFYTGIPHRVASLESDFVRVVSKPDGSRKLIAEIEYVFSTKMPDFLRRVEDEQRRYMWNFAQEEWRSRVAKNPTDLTYTLARYLASTLKGDVIKEFIGADAKKSQPMDYYVVGPDFKDKHMASGDIFSHEDGSHWVLVTPTCDLFDRKDGAKYRILAAGVELQKFPEHINWKSSKSKNSRGKIDNILKNKTERYSFLPGFLSVPSMVLDFQKLTSVNAEELTNPVWTRVASLDSPYAEEVLVRFTRYFGRIGTPDWDEATIEELLSVQDDKQG